MLRSLREGGGGANEGRPRPCSSSWAIHSASHASGLRDPLATRPRGPHADHDDLLADIQASDPVEHHLHPDHLRRVPAGIAWRDLHEADRPACSTATIRHAPGPRVELFCGLYGTRVSGVPQSGVRAALVGEGVVDEVAVTA